MDANILCQLLAHRIDGAKIHLSGLDVRWAKPEHNTPENRAIVADVLANYESLAAAYQAELDRAKADADIKARLAGIDLKSIRAMREWLAAQPDAPQFIKDHEAAAIAERAKLMK